MNYRQHFGLESHPFTRVPCTDELFDSQASRETAARLDHLLEVRGIGMLTGPSGCGKTTACRRFANSLPSGLYHPCYVSLSTGSPLDTYRLLGWELGVPAAHTRAQAYRALRDRIAQLAGEERRLPVVFIDEAHNLRNDVLEELRLLTSFEMDAAARMCLLLVGLTHLEQRLRMAVNESLQQRIILCHRFGTLTRDEIAPYLAHRLRLAGCQLDLFAPPAVEALFLAARALPRRVDRLAHYALLAAAVQDMHTVTAEHVEQAVADTGGLPLS